METSLKYEHFSDYLQQKYNSNSIKFCGTMQEF